MKLGEATLDLLGQYGVELAFGIPGVHTIELFRGLEHSGIRVVTPRHEQGAGFMADAYARVTGRPGVCLLISGPGVTNAATPIAQAYHDSIPILALASTTARAQGGGGTGSLHELPDQGALLSSITAASLVAGEAADIPEFFDRAWSVFEGQRPRPVHVAIPTDMLARECRPFAPGSRGCRRPIADPGDVMRAAERLAGASRPSILLGGGAVDGGPAAQRLAELIDAPVVMTGNANGTVGADHPLSLGATLPLAAVRRLLKQSDVVVLVGTEISDVDTIYSGVPIDFSGDIIRIDIDQGQLSAKVSPAVAIHSDAAPALAALADAIAAMPPAPTRESGLDRAQSARAAMGWTAQTESHRPWLDAIEAALPSDRIVVLDSCELAYSAHHYLRAYAPRSWIAPFGYGTLGPALPMAIGAKLGAPERPVLAIAGDGGILFTIGELATAVDLGLPLPIVVWDNAGYGEMRSAFDRAGVARVGTETSSRDLLAIARGFGCTAVEARTPEALCEAVKAALGDAGPTLIRVAAGQSAEGRSATGR